MVIQDIESRDEGVVILKLSKPLVVEVHVTIGTQVPDQVHGEE